MRNGLTLIAVNATCEDYDDIILIAVRKTESKAIFFSLSRKSSSQNGICSGQGQFPEVAVVNHIKTTACDYPQNMQS